MYNIAVENEQRTPTISGHKETSYIGNFQTLLWPQRDRSIETGDGKGLVRSR